MAYTIGSATGAKYDSELRNASAGTTRTGGDGTTWTADGNGGYTITKDGQTVGTSSTVNVTYNSGSGTKYTPASAEDTTPQNTSNNPVGWNSEWGTYQAGVNDFSTQTAKGTAGAAEGRQTYLNSLGGSITGSNGQIYSNNETTESITNRVNGTANTPDAAARNSGWNSNWNKYGNSSNMMAAAQQAAAAGDYQTAEAIENYRNAYLQSTGNTQYQASNAYQSTKKTISANNTTVTTYSYTDASGVKHDVAVTADNTFLPTGFTYSNSEDTVVDTDGSVYKVTYTWNSDGNEFGTGNWVESYSLVSKGNQQMSDLVSWLNEQYESYLNAAIAANSAATELSVQEIKAQLDNGLQQYETAAAEAYLTYVKNTDALALRNAAAGNTGGIAQRQYSAQQAACDGQLLSIALERQNFINTCNQTVAQLEAQGRYNEATILADWAKEKINAMNEAYKWTYEMAYKQDALDLEKEQNDVQKALTLLQLGVSTEDTAAQLGISEEDVEYIKNNYRNQIAQSLDSGTETPTTTEKETDIYRILYKAGCTDYQSAYNYLTTVLGKSNEIAENIAYAYGTEGYKKLKDEADAYEAALKVEDWWTNTAPRVTNAIDYANRKITISAGSTPITQLELYALLGTGEVEEVTNKNGTLTYYYTGIGTTTGVARRDSTPTTTTTDNKTGGGTVDLYDYFSDTGEAY